MTKCINCGELIENAAPDQFYCSSRCAYMFRRHHREEVLFRWPSVTFACAKCGRVVTTAPGPVDKRTRFCSAECEKKYWRHPPYDVEARTQVFRSPGEYAAYEKRTNDCVEV